MPTKLKSCFCYVFEAPSQPPGNVVWNVSDSSVILSWEEVRAMENESEVTGYKVSGRDQRNDAQFALSSLLARQEGQRMHKTASKPFQCCLLLQVLNDTLTKSHKPRGFYHWRDTKYLLVVQAGPGASVPALGTPLTQMRNTGMLERVSPKV